VEKISKPDGLKIYITGTPQIRSMILGLLINDALFTLSLAAIIIFIFLIIMEKSFTKAVLIMIPLIIGIIWTLGSMGWLGISLSIATVGIGAMILGLGVEYGAFIIGRYSEERKKKSSKESLKITVREVGGSILGSGMTTVLGFLALTLSTMPMMRDLGLSLALGIGFTLIAAIFVNPALIIFEERIEHWRTEKNHEKIKNKRKHHLQRRNLDNEKNNK
jgi:predicted RND superfamily exporter protein